MNAEVIRDSGAMELLRGEWNELLERSPADSVFLSWEWCRAWMRTLGRNVEPFVVAVRDTGNRLRALAPLYRCPATLLRCIPYRCLCVLGDRSSGAEYPDVLIDRDAGPDAEAALAGCLQHCSGEWDCLWVPRLAGWSGAASRWLRISPAAAAVQSRPRIFSAITLPADQGAYWRTLSGNMRSTVRRQRRQIEGRCEFSVLSTGDQVAGQLDTFIDLHQRRWAEVGDAGAFGRTPGLRSFYAALCREMAPTGWLRMYRLDLDGRTVALQFGLVYRSTYHQLQEGFDPDAAPGIGNVLRAKSIEHCIDEGLRAYDFLGGFTEHKRRWGAASRGGCDLFIHRRSLRTAPLRVRELWPTGRFIRMPRPAAEACTPAKAQPADQFCSR